LCGELTLECHLVLSLRLGNLPEPTNLIRHTVEAVERILAHGLRLHGRIGDHAFVSFRRDLVDHGHCFLIGCAADEPEVDFIENIPLLSSHLKKRDPGLVLRKQLDLALLLHLVELNEALTLLRTHEGRVALSFEIVSLTTLCEDSGTTLLP